MSFWDVVVMVTVPTLLYYLGTFFVLTSNPGERGSAQRNTPPGSGASGAAPPPGPPNAANSRAAAKEQ